MKLGDLIRLEAVAGIQRDISVARLGPLAASEDELQLQMDELVRSKEKMTSSDVLEDMQRIGQDGIWLRWVSERRGYLLNEAARLRAKKAEFTSEARINIARHLAVQEIRRKLELRQSRKP